jgi:uncharacterized membrane protein
MKSLRNISLLVVITLPILYLAYKWNSFPEDIPVHWNLKGEVDRYGSKFEIWVLMLLPIITYFIFWLIPKIDPKKRIKEMGNKYEQLKFFMVAVTSVISIYFLYAIDKEKMINTEIMFVLIGFIFIILGNYLPSIKPNYFVGVRTPWTLENNEVWRLTHRIAGKLFVALGIITIILVLILPIETFFWYFFSLTMLIVIYLFWYSYQKFQENNR